MDNERLLYILRELQTDSQVVELVEKLLEQNELLKCTIKLLEMQSMVEHMIECPNKG